jgi:hypothetical protein
MVVDTLGRLKVIESSLDKIKRACASTQTLNASYTDVRLELLCSNPTGL